MYLRITQRQNRDGSTVAYYALAESVWNPDVKRREARVVHSFGRADQLDRAALERLVKSINRVLDGDTGAAAGGSPRDIPEIEIERVFELGVVLAARTMWEELGIGPAIRACAERANLTAPHETALFAMAANRLDDPLSKLACAERWLPDIAWLPDAAGWQSISAIARSTSWRSGPSRSSATSSSRPPTCSALMSTWSSTTRPRPISRSTSLTKTRRSLPVGCMRRCAGEATARKAVTTSRRSSSRSPSRATACRCAPGCCPATPPT